MNTFKNPRTLLLDRVTVYTRARIKQSERRSRRGVRISLYIAMYWYVVARGSVRVGVAAGEGRGEKNACSLICIMEILARNQSTSTRITHYTCTLTFILFMYTTTPVSIQTWSPPPCRFKRCAFLLCVRSYIRVLHTIHVALVQVIPTLTSSSPPSLFMILYINTCIFCACIYNIYI